MLAIIGWALGLVGIGVVATSVSFLTSALFRRSGGRPQGRPPNVLFCLGGALLGLMLFAVGMVIGFLAPNGG